MKKYILIAVIAITSVLAGHAEAGDVSVAGQVAIGYKHSLFGIGAQVQVEPVRNFRFAPEFLYFFKNNGWSAYNVNVNLHYMLRTSPSFALYPLAGFAYANYKYHYGYHTGFGYDYTDDSETENCYGANVGMGAEYRITPAAAFFIEHRFQVMSDHNQSVTAAGFKYTF